MPWPKTGATRYQAHSGLVDKGGAIKGLVVCYVVRLESMKGMDPKTSALRAGLVPCCGVRMAIKLKYRNTKQC